MPSIHSVECQSHSIQYHFCAQTPGLLCFLTGGCHSGVHFYSLVTSLSIFPAFYTSSYTGNASLTCFLLPWMNHQAPTIVQMSCQRLTTLKPCFCYENKPGLPFEQKGKRVKDQSIASRHPNMLTGPAKVSKHPNMWVGQAKVSRATYPTHSWPDSWVDPTETRRTTTLIHKSPRSYT